MLINMPVYFDLGSRCTIGYTMTHAWGFPMGLSMDEWLVGFPLGSPLGRLEGTPCALQATGCQPRVNLLPVGPHPEAQWGKPRIQEEALDLFLGSTGGVGFACTAKRDRKNFRI